MNYEKPGKGRATIDDKGYELQVIVPSKKNFLVTLLLCAWLGGWAIGEVMVLTVILPGTAKTDVGALAFTVFWLIGWTIGGAVVISIVVWNLLGKEIVALSGHRLKLERKALRLSRSKEYSLSEIENLRVVTGGIQPVFGWPRMDAFWASSGSIAFDYGMKTVRFARAIDEAEANYTVGLMKRRMPS
jgi:hypothetical protein